MLLPLPEAFHWARIIRVDVGATADPSGEGGTAEDGRAYFSTQTTHSISASLVECRWVKDVLPRCRSRHVHFPPQKTFFLCPFAPRYDRGG